MGQSQDYFLVRRALIFAHRALAAAEILALPAALSLALFRGAPSFEAWLPMIRSSSFRNVSIFCRIVTACLSC